MRMQMGFIYASRQAESLGTEVLGKPCQPVLPLGVVHEDLPVVPRMQRQRCEDRLKSATKVSGCIFDLDRHRDGASLDA
jgi:hypothetical protein